MLHLESTRIFWGVQDKGGFSLGKDSNSAGELNFQSVFLTKLEIFLFGSVSQ